MNKYLLLTIILVVTSFLYSYLGSRYPEYYVRCGFVMLVSISILVTKVIKDLDKTK